MKIINQYALVFLNEDRANHILWTIDQAARTSYRSGTSEDKGVRDEFIKSLIEKGHESVLEHGIISAQICTTRGVSHELVRHRLASFTQESTRYCDYSKTKFGNELIFICPVGIKEDTDEYNLWLSSCQMAEDTYMMLLKKGLRPEIARDVLPSCLATNIYMTANLREWRHILSLRTAPDAHPQMRGLMKGILYTMHGFMPCIFDDIMFKEKTK